MRKEEERNIGLYFKVSPEEMEMIEKKMRQAGIRNKRAYLRKMAVDGYVIHLDMESIKSLVKYTCSISNNTNQIAKRCNETGNLYAEDMEDLKRGYAGIKAGILGLMKKFADL